MNQTSSAVPPPRDAAPGSGMRPNGDGPWNPHSGGDRISVMVVDDDPLDCELFGEYLSDWGYSVATHASVEDALQSDLGDLDVVLLDLNLPGMRGTDAVNAIRAAAPAVPVVVLTGDLRAGTPEAVIDAGAQDFVPKAQARELLDRVIRQAIRRSAFTNETSLAALHDRMTGLPNRSLLSDRLATATSVAARTGQLVGVLYLDLDGFKPVNDRHGHDAGDRLLTEVSRRLLTTVREHDTVARVGGDEFVILIADAADDRAVDEVANRVLEAVRKPWNDTQAGEVRVDVTVGVAAARGSLADPARLVTEADRACMLGKMDGRGRVRWARSLSFDESLDLLRPGGWLEVHYQPVVDMRGRIAAWEALVRLVDRHGVASFPEEFLGRLHAAGLGSHVDLFVLRQVAQDATRAALGPVCVNLSRDTLGSEEAMDQCLACLQVADVPVTVEVSERSLNSDERIERSLRRLRGAGVRVALDDFGRSSADLVTMIERDFHVVKIDRALIAKLGASSQVKPIIRAIAEAAHAADACVVAEGIEHELQLAHLDDVGVDCWQGYLHAPPLTLDAAKTLLDA